MGHASNQNGEFIFGMIVLFLIVFVFLVIRNFWLWYWKLNLIESHLAELVKLQRKAVERKN
jgi:hypothetical protein